VEHSGRGGWTSPHRWRHAPTAPGGPARRGRDRPRNPPRHRDGEMDRVLGGGLVEGSLILLAVTRASGSRTLASSWPRSRLGGRPGPLLCRRGVARQLALRAARLGCLDDRVVVVGETTVAGCVEAITTLRPPLAIVRLGADPPRPGRPRAPRQPLPGSGGGGPADGVRKGERRAHPPGRTRHQGWPPSPAPGRWSTWSTSSSSWRRTATGKTVSFVASRTASAGFGARASFRLAEGGMLRSAAPGEPSSTSRA